MFSVRTITNPVQNMPGCPVFSLDSYSYYPASPGLPGWIARRDIAVDFQRDVEFGLWKITYCADDRYLEGPVQDFLVRLEATVAHVVSGVEPEYAIDRISPKVGRDFVCYPRQMID